MPIIRASQSQLDANRLNAQKSTGPQTAHGKARSSQNALKHGLSAKTPLLPGEDPAEFAAFSEALFEDLAPHGAIEAYLVQRFADIAWRLKRLPHFEAGLMTYVASHEAHIYDNGPYPDTANAEAQRSNEAPSFRPPALEDAYRIGRMLRVMLNQDLTSKLSRYEVTLQNQLTQTLRELCKLQDERRRRATVPKDRRLVEEAELDSPDQSFSAPDAQTVHGPDWARLPLIFDDR